MEMLRVCLNNAQHTTCTHSGATSICSQTHLFVNILHETPSVQFLAALIYTKLIGHVFYPSQRLKLIQLFFKKIIFFLMYTFLVLAWFNISLDLDTTSAFFCCVLLLWIFFSIRTTPRFWMLFSWWNRALQEFLPWRLRGLLFCFPLL